MLYSKSCRHGIRALSFLARQPEGRLTLVGDIADAEDMPRPFASKILLDLVKAGLLRSTRGPGGGYGLAKPASDLSLLEIKEVFDGTAELDACAVGLDKCSDDAPCPLHEFFMPIRRSIRQYLEQTTLEDMASATERKRSLLGLVDD